MTRNLMIAVAVAVAVSVSIPATATASTVRTTTAQICHGPGFPPFCVWDYRLRFEDGDASANVVTIALGADGRVAHLHDYGDLLVPELPACFPVPLAAANCDVRLVQNPGDPNPVSSRQFMQTDIYPGAGNDRIDARELRFGRSIVSDLSDGDDSFLGGPARDFTHGGAGSDRIDGGGGNDHLFGGSEHIGPAVPGVDVIDGGGGDDEIRDWSGAATLRGGAGNDTIDSQELRPGFDAPDQVDCGPGTDNALVEADDTVINCESVQVF